MPRDLVKQRKDRELLKRAAARAADHGNRPGIKEDDPRWNPKTMGNHKGSGPRPLLPQGGKRLRRRARRLRRAARQRPLGGRSPQTRA